MVRSRTSDVLLMAALAAAAAGCGGGPLVAPSEVGPDALRAELPDPGPDLGIPVTELPYYPEPPAGTDALLAEAEATGAWPFYQRITLGDEFERIDLAWPFITLTRRGDERSFTLRPLFYTRTDSEGRVAEFLWPLGFLRQSPRLTRFRFIPLIYYTRRDERDHRGLHRDIDVSIFPVIFAGRDNREGGYFAVFPVGGLIKGVLGKKWLRFFAFPLWLDTETTHYHAWHFPWPVLGVWKGPTQAGWRVWPLAGVDRREGKFERRFFLWPLFHWWHVGLDTKYPTKVFFFFPVYGRMKNANTDHVTVLWPFFSRRRQKDRNLLEVHAPWPFFGCAKADGLTAVKIWPLWGHRSSNSIRHKFFLWPLYRRKVDRHDDVRVATRHVGILYWSVERDWIEVIEDGRVRRYPPPREDFEEWMEDPRGFAKRNLEMELALKEKFDSGEAVYRRATTRRLWPLLHSRTWADGSRQFKMLSPLPLPEGRHPGQDLYEPFWSVYNYSRSADGTKRESALLGLYRHERNRLVRHVNVLGLSDYLRVGTHRKRWRLLGGLIEYERVGAHKGFRFLWIPFKRIPREAREAHAELGAPES